MSNNSTGTFPSWGTPTLWVLLALAFGNVFVPRALNARRPATTAGAELSPHCVRARLWQDPLEAVVTVRERETAQFAAALDRKSSNEVTQEEWGAMITALDKESIGAFKRARRVTLEPQGISTEQTPSDTRCAPAHETLVLPVSLRSGPYAESRETRTRTRFAIHAGLTDYGYAATKPEELDVLCIRRPVLPGPAEESSKRSSTSLHREVLFVPYQWFVPDDARGEGTSNESDGGSKRRPDVLVLWIDEADVKTRPALEYTYIIDRAITALGTCVKGIDVRLIGPTGTDQLVELVRDTPTEPERAQEPGPLCVCDIDKKDTCSKDKTVTWCDGACIHLVRRVRSFRVLSPFSTAQHDDLEWCDVHYCEQDGSAQWRSEVKSECEVCGTTTLQTPQFKALARCKEDTKEPLIPVHRMIGFDEELADAVVLELRRRIPALMPELRDHETFVSSQPRRTDAAPASVVPLESAVIRLLRTARFLDAPPRSDVHVALLTEDDTHYGRAWADLLRTAWRRHVVESVWSLQPEHRFCDCPNPKADDPRRLPPCDLDLNADVRCRRRIAAESFPDLHFDRIPYMRGIDGQVPVSGSTTPPPNTTAKDDAKVHATGRSQVDYIRRLQRRLVKDGDSAGSDPNAKQYAAIGIIGTDVYDRLLIMQALAPLFPEAVFFTTDVDARYASDHHLPFTRNLVISSHYSLHRTPPGDRPALQTFRDSYQTAQYYCVAAALDASSVLDRRLYPDTYVVEVGSNGFVDLTSPGPPPEPDVDTPATLLASTMGVAAAPNKDASGTTLINALLLLAVLLCISPVYRSIRCFYTTAGRRHWIALALVVGLSAYTVSRVWAHANDPRVALEPMRFASGVSVWPAVLLRLFGIAFCFASALYVSVEMRRMRWLVREEFFGYRNEHHPLGPNSFGVRIRKWIAAWMRGESPRHHTRATRTMSSRFHKWMLRRRIRVAAWSAPETLRAPNDGILTSNGCRSVRSACFALLFITMVSPLFVWLGRPGSPARGHAALLADKSTVFLFAFSLLFLIFVVMDTNWSTARFLRSLIPDGRLTRPAIAAYQGLSENASDLDYELAKARMQVRIAERISERIGSFVFLPAIGVCILLLARLNVFDRFAWPKALLITLGLLFLFLVFCTWTLTVAARELKRDAIDDLDELTREPRCRFDSSRARRIAEASTEIAGFDRGVFAPFLQQPIVRAALLPIALMGSGSIAASMNLTPPM